MTLAELRDRISEEQITRDEVIASLREPLTLTDDDGVRSKLKQAITSANIYYSSRKWGALQNPGKSEGATDLRHYKSRRMNGSAPPPGQPALPMTALVTPPCVLTGVSMLKYIVPTHCVMPARQVPKPQSGETTLRHDQLPCMSGGIYQYTLC